MDSRFAPDAAPVLSVDKALSVMELLISSTEPLPAREIAAQVGINRTTTHRLLNSLIHAGWVERCPTGGYRLSVKFLALAHLSTQVRSFLSEIHPFLIHLAQISRETVHVGVLDGLDVVHIEKIDSLQSVGVSSRVGVRAVTHRTALGRALLAVSSDDFVDHYLRKGRQRKPPFTVDSAEAVWETVRQTREHGYSIDDEDDSIGVRCLGVAVTGAGNLPLFAISLTGPSPRFTRVIAERLAPEMLSVAAELSSRFGGDRSSSLHPGDGLKGLAEKARTVLATSEAPASGLAVRGGD
jgi:IclR family transcriptional regulator, KDG regulon repressor